MTPKLPRLTALAALGCAVGSFAFAATPAASSAPPPASAQPTSVPPAAPSPLVVPRLTHPGAGQTFYFVLTDRFANGSAANDLGGFTGGPEETGFDPTRVSHYHGGDLAGLTAKLDYLKQLGITAVWLTPPFANKPVQSGSAGYHGYWILDFLRIDPHLGTNDEFRRFVTAAHERGLKVYMDIIVNHTADVIHFGGDTTYRPRGDAPYHDAAGKPFDERRVAFNGLGDPNAFPRLAADRSFPFRPVVPENEQHAKNPVWLNDVTLYHNRGNTSFAGENSTLGDFVGLDDTFTEHPRVVRGFIGIFTQWMKEYGVDGFRIDTARHVNSEFWQAFMPAIREQARALGRPEFLAFGEVANDQGDVPFLSEFSTGIPIDTTLDFGFFVAARKFVSQQHRAAELAEFFASDDYYTDHDSNVHVTTTFLGNHDAGRFAYFLKQDNPDASAAQLAALVRFGHGLLFLSRGQPVVYYGDEQGMVGRGGNDMQAREDMFAAQAPDFRAAPLLATKRTGADDKFDESHPFYRLIAQLATLRSGHQALRTGAMLPRPTSNDDVFAFSRIERAERIEYLVVLNRSRTQSLTADVPTIATQEFRLLFDSRSLRYPEHEAAWLPDVTTIQTDARGHASLTIEPLEFSVWRAVAPLPAADAANPAAPLDVKLSTPATNETLTFTTREIDGLTFPSRHELRAELGNTDGFAEVTFTMTRASRPSQHEYLGTDDTFPYRIFWRPPPDLAPGETLTFTATANDLRGRTAVSSVSGVKVSAKDIQFGTRGALVPTIRLNGATALAAKRPLVVRAGKPLKLDAAADGTAPLEFQWLRNGEEIPGSTRGTLQVSAATAADAGSYRVLVRNRAGTTVSEPITLRVE